jgi:hypothetical protein
MMSKRWKHGLAAAIGVVLFAILAWNEHRIAAGLLADGMTLGDLCYQRGVIWLGALGTLAVYSFLIGQNPFYHAFEYALLGCATGMGIAIALQDALIAKCLVPIREGFHLLASEGPTVAAVSGIILVVPALVGLLWYSQFSKRYFWLSRIPLVVGLGAGAGLAFKDLFNRILPQVTGTFKTLWPGESVMPGVDLWTRAGVAAENTIFVVGTISVLSYFFFAFGRKTVVSRAPARLGRWYLMLSLGAFFGTTFMSRLSALNERVHFLFAEWLRWSAPW